MFFLKTTKPTVTKTRNLNITKLANFPRTQLHLSIWPHFFVIYILISTFSVPSWWRCWVLGSMSSFTQNQIIYHYLHNIFFFKLTNIECGSRHKSNMYLSRWLVLQLELAVLFADSGTQGNKTPPR